MSGTALLAYSRWHARDGLVRALVPVLIFAGIGGIPIWSLVAQQGLASSVGPGQTHDSLAMIYTQTMELAMTLGAVVLMGGLVADDRERGYFRFLFAAPVVPWQHYLLRFVIGVALYSTCFALVPISFGAALFEVPIVAAVRAAVLYGFLYGSVAMLGGALFNRDGVFLIVVVLVSGMLQQLAKGGMLSRAATVVAWALPPVSVVADVRTSWLAGRPSSGNDLLLVVGYSLGLLASALWIVRRAPLAR